MTQTKVEQHLIENNASSFRNIIHNGAMQVAQKGTVTGFTADPLNLWCT